MNFFDKVFGDSEEIDVLEMTAAAAGFTYIIIHIILDVFFYIVWSIKETPEMFFLNASSIVIGFINIYFIINRSRLNLGISILVANTCYYMLYSTYCLGYEKNAGMLFPLLILVIFNFFMNKPKYLIANGILLFISWLAMIYIKIKVDSKYSHTHDYIDIVNNLFAICGTIIFITVRKLIENKAKLYINGEMDRLQGEVSIDYLTDLYNRRYMEQRFEEDVGCCNSYIALGDIDFFKKINDTYGHSCGDFVLKEIATLFKSEFGENSDICRWGGEEFLIYVKDSKEEEIKNKLDEIRIAVSKKIYEYNEFKFKVTITFGLSKIENNIEMDDNIKNADAALYYGKENGRNKVVMYSDVRDEILGVNKAYYSSVNKSI